MEWNGSESTREEWNGMEWNGTERNGKEWNGMNPNGMEWIGMEWNGINRSEEHTSELQSPCNLVCRLLLEKKKFGQQGIVAINFKFRSVVRSRVYLALARFMSRPMQMTVHSQAEVCHCNGRATKSVLGVAA